MTTFLIVLGIVLGYFAVGAVYARSQSVRLFRKARKEWTYESLARESLHMMIAWRVVAWPYAVVFDLFAGPLRTWMTAPLTERRERAEQLLRDAEHWKAEARDEVDPEKRAAFQELARVLFEQAEEAKL